MLIKSGLSEGVFQKCVKQERRLSYKGLGHTQPLTQERTAAEQQMNRRVEIRIVKK